MNERTIMVDKIINSQILPGTIAVWCKTLDQSTPLRLILTREAAEEIQKELRFV